MATLTVGENFKVMWRCVTYEFEVAEEGGYVVWVPAYPSCLSQGESFEEALASIEEALTATLSVAHEHGLDIPEELHPMLGLVSVDGA